MDLKEIELDSLASPHIPNDNSKRIFVLYEDESWNEVPKAVDSFQCPFIPWESNFACKETCIRLSLDLPAEAETVNIVWGSGSNSSKSGVYAVLV